MGKGAVKLPIDGSELIDLYNSSNTKDVAYSSLSDIADYINSLGIPAEIVMISLLQDISKKIDCLSMIGDQLSTNNEYLRKIYNPE